MSSTRVSKWFRRRTAALRALPDFLIVGTQKGGTSSLFAYLAQHPQVRPARVKEVHFFDKKWREGIGSYRAEFPLRASLWRAASITGEATPVTMFHPLAPERVARCVPQARLIFLLRDPVERAFSHYRMSVYKGVEELTFEQALGREEERLAGEFARLERDPFYFSQPLKRHSYRIRGQYAEQIERWLEHFPRQQMLFVQSERLFADPAAVYGEVLAFLGLPEHQLADPKPRNVGTGGVVAARIRADLVRHFAPWNDRLFRLLDVRYDWSRA